MSLQMNDNSGVYRPMNLYGLDSATQIDFQCQQFYRKASTILYYNAINETTGIAARKSDQAGWLGLAPIDGFYEKDLPKEYSLIYKLYSDRRIDHMIFSIYLAPDKSKKSTIKFGGWDQAGIAEGHNLTMFKGRFFSNSHANWELDWRGMKVGSTAITINGDATGSDKRVWARIDPYFPMIIVSQSVY